MEGADPARLGLDPGRDLSRDQKRRPDRSFTRCTSRRASASNMRRSSRASAPVDRGRDRQGLRGLQGPIRPARSRRDRERQARKPQDARPRPVRRRRRHRGDVFREALLRRPGRRSRRRGLSSSCARRCKDAKKIGVGQMAMRGQEYVVAIKPCGPRDAAGDAALRRRGAQGVGLTSATSATPSPTRTCSTWPRC